MTLADSMERVVEIPDREALMVYLLDNFDFWEPTPENVTCKFYARDERIDWDTHLICIDGKAALFADGPIP